MKKAMSLILSLILAFSAFAVTASAEEAIVTEPNSQVMYSVTGAEAAPEFVAMIEEYNVEVRDETKIELVPLQTKARSNVQNNALVITNKNGSNVTKDVLLFGDDEGIGVVENSGIARSSSYTGDYPMWDNGKYVVHGTAEFNEYRDPQTAAFVYQPIGVSYIYEKTGECNVTMIALAYSCHGEEWYASNYSPVGTEIDYVIQVSQGAPQAWVRYFKTQPYRNDQVIYPGGVALGGQYLSFNISADGKADRYSLAI